MTRRKSKPLLPHEVFSSCHSSQDGSENATFSTFSANGSSQHQAFSSQSSVLGSQPTKKSLHDTLQDKSSVEVPVDELVTPSTIAPTIENSNGVKWLAKNVRDYAKPLETSIAPDGSLEKSQNRTPGFCRSHSQTTLTSQRPGYLANRRRASFIVAHDAESSVGTLPGSHRVGYANDVDRDSNPPKSLKRTSSLVRLSMSLDGKAQVTTGTGTTPSPPRSQPAPISNSSPRPNTGLQRSQSALEPSQKSGLDIFPLPYSRSRLTGRSRDARTWEFYCDSDARNALTEQAELEESGSATAAIGLIRSRSNNSKAMTPNANKRNAHPQRHNPIKRQKGEGGKTSKPKLARATSSVARLQTVSSNAQNPRTMSKDKDLKSCSQSALYETYDGDSDKENWEPGTQISNPRGRRPANVQQSIRILEESLRVPSQSSSLDALMDRENINSRRSSSKATSSSEEKENANPEVDDEVATFMSESVPREVEDLDCVQNLLSLSQAAWQ